MGLSVNYLNIEKHEYVNCFHDIISCQLSDVNYLMLWKFNQSDISNIIYNIIFDKEISLTYIYIF